MKLSQAYEVVQALNYYSDAPRTEKDKSKIISGTASSIEDINEDLKAFEKSEEASLYAMGSVSMPRSLLYHPTMKNLSRAARSVYLWIMTKQRILENAAAAGIESEETARLPIVTARNIEIAKYTGIGAAIVSRYTKELEKAGLIRTKKVKNGGKITATLFKLPTWTVDKMGYISVPIKTMLTPAWVSLEHNAKWIWLLILSERNAKKDNGNLFPYYEIAYSQIKKSGIGSDRTIRRMTVELEELGFVNIRHGQVITKKPDENDEKEKEKEPVWWREMNAYQISADHLHMYKHTVDAIKAGLKKMWAHETKEKTETEQPASAVA